MYNPTQSLGYNANETKAQKFSRAIDDVEEDDLGEDSVLLESPLDKIEPYQLFRGTLMSEPFLYSLLDIADFDRNATRATPILQQPGWTPHC